MEYSVSDIEWLKKSISSMEEKGLAKKGHTVASEISLPDGKKAIRVKIEDHVADLPNAIEAINYIVDYGMQLSKRRLMTGSVISGALVGGTVSAINRKDILLGISVGSIISLVTSYYMTERLKG